MQLKRNIPIILISDFLKGLVFFLPIYTLYLQQELFTTVNVTLIIAVQAGAQIVFEVPSGAIADLFGRKRTLVVSSFLSVVALAFLFRGGSLLPFLAYAIISACARSLLSGTDTALLFETLQHVKSSWTFKKAVAVNNTMWPLGAAISSAIGGLLATYSLRLPIFMTLFPFSLALILTLFLREAPRECEEHNNVFRHMKESFHVLHQQKQILLLILAGLLFYAFSESAHQLNPLFFSSKDIPIALFGFLYTGIFTMSSLGSFLSHALSERIGNKVTLIFSALAPPLLLFLATLLNGVFAAFPILLGSFFWSIRWPVMSHLLNVRLSSKKRATVISLGNFGNQLGLMLFVPLFGLIVDMSSILTAFRVAAVLSCGVVLLLLFVEDKE